MTPEILAGTVATGLAVEKVRDNSRTLAEWFGLIEHAIDPIPGDIAELKTLLTKLVEFTTAHKEGDVELLAAFTNSPTTLDRKGKMHLAVFTNVAVNVVVDVSAIGPYAVTLPAGWSSLDFTDNSTIVTAGLNAVQNVIVRATDTLMGNLV